MVKRQTRADRIFDIINALILILIFIIVLYPLIFIVSASFSDPNEIYAGNVWLLPKKITFTGYERIFQHAKIWQGYLNTIIYTIVGTCVNIVFTISAAYALSRKDFLPRKVLMGLYLFTMFFSGGMIPGYLVVKNLHLLNTMWALILPGAVSTWNLIVCRTFFNTSIPDDLLEAAQLDGCGDFLFFFKIVIPLSAAIIAVMTMFYAVGHWNSYFSALLYLTDRTKYPLQLVLRDILIKSEMEKTLLQGDLAGIAEQQKAAESIKFGVMIVSSVPMMLLYPLVQKHFVKGIMIGSLKG